MLAQTPLSAGIQHCFLAFSALPFWFHCAAQPQLAALVPGFEEDGDEARAGTASHWYAEQRLRGLPIIGAHAPNGVLVDDEMREVAEVHVRDVQAAVAGMSERDPGVVWGVEHFARATAIHPEHCGGTVDAFAYSPKLRLLKTWNYKFGHGEVSEFENPQEVGYAAALLEFLQVDGHAEQGLAVEMTIVQPRCYTARAAVRAWRTPATALRPLWNRMRDQAAEAMGPSPRATPGEHCEHCPARHACPAAQRGASMAVSVATRGLPQPLSGHALGYELEVLERAAAMIDARLTGLREDARQRLLRREKVGGGWALESQPGKLGWLESVTDEQLRALEAPGLDLFKPKRLTPTQALDAGLEATLVLGSPETGVPPLASRGTSLKLVRQDPRRMLAHAPEIPQHLQDVPRSVA